MRRAVVQFALSGLAALVLLGFVTVEVLRKTGTSEAIDDAKEMTELAGRGIVEPMLTDALLDGDPDAIAALDGVVKRSIVRDRDVVVRVKIWTRSEEHTSELQSRQYL